MSAPVIEMDLRPKTGERIHRRYPGIATHELVALLDSEEEDVVELTKRGRAMSLADCATTLTSAVLVLRRLERRVPAAKRRAARKG